MHISSQAPLIDRRFRYYEGMSRPMWRSVQWQTAASHITDPLFNHLRVQQFGAKNWRKLLTVALRFERLWRQMTSFISAITGSDVTNHLSIIDDAVQVARAARRKWRVRAFGKTKLGFVERKGRGWEDRNGAKRSAKGYIQHRNG